MTAATRGRPAASTNKKNPANPPSFQSTLADRGLTLVRNTTDTLQINVGLKCNQACRHCHLSAGPQRAENMDRRTAEAVVAYARRAGFQTIDITGGAPELNPNAEFLVAELSELAPRLMFRSNLSALNSRKRSRLLDLLVSRRAVIVASFPSLNPGQADAQRGSGIFSTSIDALTRLNALGYGRQGSGLELNLVSNPVGAFLPPAQSEAEARFRRVLKGRWGIVFNRYYSFANVPLGRFRNWLKHTENFQRYMQKLVSAFNSCALDGVMCRSLVSVAWDGYLFDCDFNLACGLPMSGRKVHVSDLDGPPAAGAPIATADHCYTCTAGSGFT